jgi:Cys-rich protein (TIGR01571 family)
MSNQTSADYSKVVIGDVSVVQAVPVRTLQVVAPVDLEAGYELDVMDPDGQSNIIRVPEGGARKGELFTGITVCGESHSDHYNIPRGAWRDDLCDCCKHGCCHAMLCLACWCPPLALGQVMTRMRLDPCASKTQGGVYWTAFKVLALVYFVFFATVQALTTLTTSYVASHTQIGEGNIVALPVWVLCVQAVHHLLNLLFTVYVVFILTRTRAHVRRAYDIPEMPQIRRCEDCCCAFWCTPCVITQMARHTADYSTYRADCCSDTGLSERVPQVYLPEIV